MPTISLDIKEIIDKKETRDTRYVVMRWHELIAKCN